MDAAALTSWLAVIAALTPAQRGEVWQALALAEAADSEDHETHILVQLGSAGVAATAPDEPVSAVAAPLAPPPNQAAADSIAALGQRRVDLIGCPHCEAHAVMRWGRASAIPRYRCKTCRRTFNALTKTPLAHLRMKEKWAGQAGAMIEGISLAKVAERLDVDGKTAFRWRHRFLASLVDDKPRVLSGIVEGDETFILESFKGRRSGMPRPARKRGGKSAKRGLSAEQIPVIVARDRHGSTTEAVLPKLNRVSITTALGGVVTPANDFCCDGGSAIVAFARKAGNAYSAGAE